MPQDVDVASFLMAEFVVELYEMCGLLSGKPNPAECFSPSSFSAYASAPGSQYYCWGRRSKNVYGNLSPLAKCKVASFSNDRLNSVVLAKEKVFWG